MAPYIPQNAHYAHLDVCEYDSADLYAFVGRGGRRFYGLTRQLHLKYLWFNPDNKVIEVWGSYEAMLGEPVQVVREELSKFMSQRLLGDPSSDIETPNSHKENVPPNTPESI